MASVSKKTQGVLYILTAAFGFSVITLFVKLAGDLPAFQTSFFRNFVTLLFIVAMMVRDRVNPIPEKKNIPDLLGRSFFGTVGLLFNFYAIGQLNLSDANMLNKLSPFFAILFSVFLLGEKPTLMQIGGVCVAFLGSVCIIKPSFQNPAMLPALAGMLGGMGAGIAYTFVRRLGMKGENSKRIIFWFSAFSCLFCLPFLLFTYEPMSAKQLLYLMGSSASPKRMSVRPPRRSRSTTTRRCCLRRCSVLSSSATCRMCSAFSVMCSSAAQASGCIFTTIERRHNNKVAICFTMWYTLDGLVLLCRWCDYCTTKQFRCAFLTGIQTAESCANFQTGTGAYIKYPAMI